MKRRIVAAFLVVAGFALPISTFAAGSLEDEMRAAVANLIAAAQKRTTLWPWKAAEPQVAVVASYGRAIAPLLVVHLSDDPDSAEGVDWNVQQQVALALCKIYGVTEEGGHVYSNRAAPNINARVKLFWVSKVAEPP